MEYETLFARLPHETPAGLAGRVRAAVASERRRALRVRRAALGGALAANLASLAGLFVAVPRLVFAARASGFTAYASLVRTDWGVVAAHASSFALGLLEALPGIELALTLLLLAVFLATARRALQGPRAVLSTTRLFA